MKELQPSETKICTFCQKNENVNEIKLFIAFDDGNQTQYRLLGEFPICIGCSKHISPSGYGHQVIQYVKSPDIKKKISDFKIHPLTQKNEIIRGSIYQFIRNEIINYFIKITSSKSFIEISKSKLSKRYCVYRASNDVFETITNAVIEDLKSSGIIQEIDGNIKSDIIELLKKKIIDEMIVAGKTYLDDIIIKKVCKDFDIEEHVVDKLIENLNKKDILKFNDLNVFKHKISNNLEVSSFDNAKIFFEIWSYIPGLLRTELISDFDKDHLKIEPFVESANMILIQDSQEQKIEIGIKKYGKYRLKLSFYVSLRDVNTDNPLNKLIKEKEFQIQILPKFPEIECPTRIQYNEKCILKIKKYDLITNENIMVEINNKKEDISLEEKGDAFNVDIAPYLILGSKNNLNVFFDINKVQSKKTSKIIYIEKPPPIPKPIVIIYPENPVAGEQIDIMIEVPKELSEKVSVTKDNIELEINNEKREVKEEKNNYKFSFLAMDPIYILKAKFKI